MEKNMRYLERFATSNWLWKTAIKLRQAKSMAGRNQEISTEKMENWGKNGLVKETPIKEHLFCNFSLSIKFNTLDTPER